VVAREAGVPPDQVRVLAAGEEPGEGFGPRERAVVALCDRLVRDAAGVDDALMSELREHLGDHEIVELTLLAGAITMLNYVASAFRLPLDPRTVEALAA
jgi:alkylhydroperoxidase family enzyme